LRVLAALGELVPLVVVVAARRRLRGDDGARVDDVARA